MFHAKHILFGNIVKYGFFFFFFLGSNQSKLSFMNENEPNQNPELP